MGKDSVASTMASLIRDYRKSMGWTQSRAARECGVSRVTWNRWESGVRTPTDANWEIIKAAVTARLEMDPVVVPSGQSYLPENIPKRLGTLLKKFRYTFKHNGKPLTQRHAGLLAGVRETKYKRLEAGRTTIDSTRLFVMVMATTDREDLRKKWCEDFSVASMMAAQTQFPFCQAYAKTLKYHISETVSTLILTDEELDRYMDLIYGKRETRIDIYGNEVKKKRSYWERDMFNVAMGMLGFEMVRMTVFHRPPAVADRELPPPGARDITDKQFRTIRAQQGTEAKAKRPKKKG